MVTEFLLIRTRAENVAAIWNLFFRQFPDRDALRHAPPAAVAKVLEPLGLRWRAELIQRWASDPSAEEPDLGRGEYVRAAARMAVSGSGTLPVDVTIARVIGRILGIEGRELRRSPAVREAVERLGEVDRDEFHSILDLAAVICKPTRPKCPDCPMRADCLSAHLDHRTSTNRAESTLSTRTSSSPEIRSPASSSSPRTRN